MGKKISFNFIITVQKNLSGFLKKLWPKTLKSKNSIMTQNDVKN